MYLLLNYFKVRETDVRIANCNYYSSEVAQGGNKSLSFSVTNLKTHLKGKNPEKLFLFLLLLSKSVKKK